jgi:hypothetical protein
MTRFALALVSTSLSRAQTPMLRQKGAGSFGLLQIPMALSCVVLQAAKSAKRTIAARRENIHVQIPTGKCADGAKKG